MVMLRYCILLGMASIITFATFDSSMPYVIKGAILGAIFGVVLFRRKARGRTW